MNRINSKMFAAISAAAVLGGGSGINATWDAVFTIENPAVAAEHQNPNPSAMLDAPDGTTNKMKPTTGPEAAPNGTMAPGKDGKPPIPKFNMMAYNGGPIRLSGWAFPVMLANPKPVAANVPIYVGHIVGPSRDNAGTSESEKIEMLAGQTSAFSVDPSSGAIGASGSITGETATVKKALAHAKNGFKWQASINAPPPSKDQVEFLKQGETRTVSGRIVCGPMCIVHDATIDHIAIVPLGADTSTSTNIAASTAQQGAVMEFAAWLKATYAMDAASLTAEQKTKFEAEFARISAAGATGSAAGGVTAGTPANPAPVIATHPNPPPDFTAALTAQNAAYAGNLERIGKVTEAAKEHPAIAAQAIKENWSLDKTELAVLRAERAASEKNQAPGVIAGSSEMPKDGLGIQAIPAARGGRHTAGVSAGTRIGNDLACVIECAGLISAGYSAERLSKSPSYGARTVEMAEKVMRRFGQGLGPAGIMRLAASYGGVHLPHSNSDPEFLSTIRAAFSTLSLPTILSNLMNKFLLDGWSGVDPDQVTLDGSIAWQKFTKRGPLQDFKPHYRVRIAGNMEMQNLAPTGEIQHGKVSEQSYTLQAITKAIMFGLARKDIVNDDLSAFSTLPTLFGRGAGISVAKAIYTAIITGLQSDGTTAFFTSSAITTSGNLMQPNLLLSNGLSLTALEAVRAAFGVQTDPYGQPAGTYGQVLVVPPALVSTAMQLWQADNLIPQLVTSGSANKGVPSTNSVKGLFRPVSSQWLSALANGSNSTHYCFGGPQNAAYPIEAGFLNGQEMPIVERDEMQFDMLGIQFRGFIDFGVSMAEPRAAVKSTA